LTCINAIINAPQREEEICKDFFLKRKIRAEFVALGLPDLISQLGTILFNEAETFYSCA
jgi:hypothetical protein